MNRKTARLILIIAFAAAAAASGWLVVAGLRSVEAVPGTILLAAGALGFILVLASAAIGLMLLARMSSGGPGGTDTRRMETLLSEIHEHTMLTDNARRVLYREREMDLLRRTIDHDIAKGDYNTALTLCDELANLFGSRQEAEAFRTRILQARHERYEASVHAAMEQFEQLLRERDWARAHQEAARIRRLFPDSHVVTELDQRILGARDQHKNELEAQFRDAAQKEDIELAMNLLKQLDRYLTREEAASLTQVAQAVVAKHRKNLEVQFKLAVNDRRWVEAARIGETIMAEFPNTKMADEVRGMIHTIRTRATEAALAGPAPTSYSI